MTNPLDTAADLLTQAPPELDQLPARVEALNLCGFAVARHVASLQDVAGRHEEEATESAATESNDSKRRARRAELLRADDAYNQLRDEIAAAESYRFRLDERAARLRREFRLRLIQLEQEGARDR